MSQLTTAILDGTRYNPDYFWREPLAKISWAKTDRTTMVGPFVGAALSVLCLFIICFFQDPWFAVAGFVAAYGLFWVGLSVQAVPQTGNTARASQ